MIGYINTLLFMILKFTIHLKAFYKILFLSMELNTQELKKRLTPLQFQVTQNSRTEDPYKNEYYLCKKKGIYTCIVCSEPLFSSEAKYDSGTGWPSFYESVEKQKVANIYDKKHYAQTRCKKCNSHLGHVFHDGPKDKTGLRYCINSASLKLKQL